MGGHLREFGQSMAAAISNVGASLSSRGSDDHQSSAVAAAMMKDVDARTASDAAKLAASERDFNARIAREDVRAKNDERKAENEAKKVAALEKDVDARAANDKAKLRIQVTESIIKRLDERLERLRAKENPTDADRRDIARMELRVEELECELQKSGVNGD